MSDSTSIRHPETGAPGCRNGITYFTSHQWRLDYNGEWFCLDCGIDEEAYRATNRCCGACREDRDSEPWKVQVKARAEAKAEAKAAAKAAALKALEADALSEIPL